MFRNLPLKVRTIAALVLLLSLTLVVAVVGHVNSNALKQRGERDFREKTLALNQLTELTEHAAKVRLSIREMILARDPQETAERFRIVDERLPKIVAITESLEKTPSSGSFKEALGEYKEILGGYVPIVEEMRRLGTSGQYDAARKYLFDVCIHQQAKFEPAVDKLRALKLSEAQESQKAAQLASERTGVVVMAAVVGAVVAIVALGLMFVRSVFGPLGVAVTALRAISEGRGDLSQRLPALGRNELGDLCGAFNRFVENLDHLVLKVNETSAAAGAETTTLRRAAKEMGDSSAAIDAAMERLIQGAERQAQALEEANREVESLRTMIASVARRADDQSTRMESVSSSVEEIESMSATVDARASETAEATLASAQAAEAGKAAIGEFANAMARLDAAMQAAEGRTTELEASLGEIGQILGAIRDIAEQTNLLALNAAIEAARAGEHGRGFAVVAEEVRKLADRSSEQTQQIASLLEGISDRTRQAVSAMRAGSEEATTAGEAVSATETQFSLIIEQVGRISGQSQQVSASATAIRREIGEVRSAIDEVSRASAETAQEAGRMESSGDSVVRRLGDLDRQSRDQLESAHQATEAGRAQSQSLVRLMNSVGQVEEVSEALDDRMSQFRNARRAA